MINKTEAKRYSLTSFRGIIASMGKQFVLASDYEALLAERDALNMERGWVRVEDQLPEISHNEIVLWNGRWCRVGCYLDSLKHGPGFYSPHDDRLKGVTHWMLLPPAPASGHNL